MRASCRFPAFMTNNPTWPSNTLMRRRAEARLWQEKADPATIRAFFGDKPPLTAKGRFALARAWLAEGDRLEAAREAKAAWRAEELGEATEEMAPRNSRTCWRARTIAPAWTSGSAPRRWVPRCAPQSGSAMMTSRSSRPARR